MVRADELTFVAKVTTGRWSRVALVEVEGRGEAQWIANGGLGRGWARWIRSRVDGW